MCCIIIILLISLLSSANTQKSVITFSVNGYQLVIDQENLTRLVSCFNQTSYYCSLIVKQNDNVLILTDVVKKYQAVESSRTYSLYVKCIAPSATFTQSLSCIRVQISDISSTSECHSLKVTNSDFNVDQYGVIFYDNDGIVQSSVMAVNTSAVDVTPCLVVSSSSEDTNSTATQGWHDYTVALLSLTVSSLYNLTPVTSVISSNQRHSIEQTTLILPSMIPPTTDQQQTDSSTSALTLLGPLTTSTLTPHPIVYLPDTITSEANSGVYLVTTTKFRSETFNLNTTSTKTTDMFEYQISLSASTMLNDSTPNTQVYRSESTFPSNSLLYSDPIIPWTLKTSITPLKEEYMTTIHYSNVIGQTQSLTTLTSYVSLSEPNYFKPTAVESTLPTTSFQSDRTSDVNHYQQLSGTSRDVDLMNSLQSTSIQSFFYYHENLSSSLSSSSSILNDNSKLPVTSDKVTQISNFTVNSILISTSVIETLPQLLSENLTTQTDLVTETLPIKSSETLLLVTKSVIETKTPFLPFFSISPSSRIGDANLSPLSTQSPMESYLKTSQADFVVTSNIHSRTTEMSTSFPYSYLGLTNQTGDITSQNELYLDSSVSSEIQTTFITKNIIDNLLVSITETQSYHLSLSFSTIALNDSISTIIANIVTSKPLMASSQNYNESQRFSLSNTPPSATNSETVNQSIQTSFTNSIQDISINLRIVSLSTTQVTLVLSATKTDNFSLAESYQEPFDTSFMTSFLDFSTVSTIPPYTDEPITLFITSASVDLSNKDGTPTATFIHPMTSTVVTSTLKVVGTGPTSTSTDTWTTLSTLVETLLTNMLHIVTLPPYLTTEYVQKINTESFTEQLTQTPSSDYHISSSGTVEETAGSIHQDSRSQLSTDMDVVLIKLTDSTNTILETINNPAAELNSLTPTLPHLQIHTSSIIEKNSEIETAFFNTYDRSEIIKITRNIADTTNFFLYTSFYSTQSLSALMDESKLRLTDNILSTSLVSTHSMYSNTYSPYSDAKESLILPLEPSNTNYLTNIGTYSSSHYFIIMSTNSLSSTNITTTSSIIPVSSTTANLVTNYTGSSSKTTSSVETNRILGITLGVIGFGILSFVIIFLYKLRRSFTKKKARGLSFDQATHVSC